MNLSAPWIKRPVMTTLVMVGILIFGIVGYTQLPVSDVPNVVARDGCHEPRIARATLEAGESRRQTARRIRRWEQ